MAGSDGCGCFWELLDVGHAIDMLLACFDNWQAVLAFVLWLAGGVVVVLVLAHFGVAALWYYVGIGGYLAVTIGVVWACNAAEVRRLR